MTTPIKTICIYHANCADGFGAAWVVRKALGNDIEFHAAKHGEPVPDVTGKTVVIVDFSYPRAVLTAMAESAHSVLVLDHHKTAQEDLLDLPSAGASYFDEPEQPNQNMHVLFDMSRSGAGLAWDYFFPYELRPALIYHIEDRDLWRFNLEGTREVLASLFSYKQDFAIWDELFAVDSAALRFEGRALERKQQKDVAELVAASKRRMNIAHFNVPVANLPHTFASDAGALMSVGQPFAACYWDTAEGRSFSLRSSDAGEDVSVIAKRFGGGGHRNAAGFRVPFNHMLASPEQADPEQALKKLDKVAWLLAEGVLMLNEQNPDHSDWVAEAKNALATLTHHAPDPATAAIEFALEDEDGLNFLRLWNEGSFDSIREHWPDAPEEVFIGADPLHCPEPDDKGPKP
ncbi:phosphohydrolase [Pseudomonas sp. Irchel 3A5]|uniref:phosphohydrolase n=1 Tax=Pseudomonas sp. Irchel 3A5 TaxID=2008911 RepID=UPI001C467D08|nr:phosphohydrolase [Pseudomonas sp. Irchel 3A5]